MSTQRQRFAIQVVYPSGAVAYLRHGGRVGEGAVVQFRDRKTADVNVDFVSMGMDQGTVVSVVRYDRTMETSTPSAFVR